MTHTIKLITSFTSDQIDRLPHRPAIYFIRDAMGNVDGNLTINSVLYIGETEDIHDRFANGHEKLELIEARLPKGHIASVVFADASHLSEESRKTVQDCLIYVNQPPFNEKAVESYNRESTRVYIDAGRYRLPGIENPSII